MNKEEAKLKSFIISQLRGSFRKYFVKYEVLREAATEKKVNTKTGRVAQHYKCNGCSKEFPQSEVQVDHIHPVVKANGFSSWDDYISSLFCPKDNLQVLCLTCHKAKTKAENAERRETKRGKIGNR
jgi:5-methylcytosine-specific restriction endonuclease McrA